MTHFKLHKATECWMRSVVDNECSVAKNLKGGSHGLLINTADSAEGTEPYHEIQ